MRFGRLHSQAGSSIVEALIAIPFVAILVTAGFASLYIAFAFVWTERAGYEALVCLGTQKTSVRECEEQFRKVTGAALPLGVASVRSSRSMFRAQLRGSFTLNDKTIFSYHPSLALPLGGRK